jgi:hypothetical protein
MLAGVFPEEGKTKSGGNHDRESSECSTASTGLRTSLGCFLLWHRGSLRLPESRVRKTRTHGLRILLSGN